YDYKIWKGEENHGLGDLCHDGMPLSDVTLFKALNSRMALDHQKKLKHKREMGASTITPLLETEGCNGEITNSTNSQST
ncbi:hypothetical protein, partial [Streptococcus pseudopneumoniae]